MDTSGAVLSWQSGWGWAAAGLVFAHGYLRFNTPPTSRSSTTFRRFHTAAILYAFTVVLAWGVLTALPPGVAGRLITGWPEDLQGVAWPFATALVLTTLLPTLPGVQSFDVRVRSAFHELARITEEAEALTTRLVRTALLVDEQLRADVRQEFEAADLDPDDAVFDGSRDPRALWTRLTAMKLTIQRWEWRGPFRRFYEANRREIRQVEAGYQALEATARRRLTQLRRLESERHDLTLGRLVAELVGDAGRLSALDSDRESGQMRDRVERRLELLRQLDDDNRDRPLGEVAADLHAQFGREVQRLEHEMLGLVARATLQVGRTKRTRTALLRTVGFQDVVPARDPFLDRLTGLFLLLFLYYPIALVAAPVRGGSTPTERLLIGVAIAVVYAAAIVAAVYPKRWGFFERDDAGRPIRGYAVAALIASVSWVVVFLSLWMTATGTVREALNRLQPKWPWAVMAAATAFATAWTVDDQPRRHLRWIETAGQAAVGTVAAAIVLYFLRSTEPPSTGPYWLTVRSLRIVAVAAATGAVIGACVPHWYRSSRLDRQRAAEELAGATPACTWTPPARTKGARATTGALRAAA